MKSGRLRRALGAPVRKGGAALGGWNREMRRTARDDVRRGSRPLRSMALALPAVGALAGMGVALSQGLLAANFMVVDKPFTIKSDQVVGGGFAALMHERLKDDGADGASEGMVRAGFKSAKLDGLCGYVHQSIAGVDYTLKIRAGEVVDGTPEGTDPEINASDLILEATAVDGTNSSFADMFLGKSADDVQMGGTPLSGGTAGEFGLEAGTVTVDDLTASAYTVELIGSIGLPQLKLNVELGQSTC
ncbi:DUF6230 family protein [Haloechinothrix salitolerans]|uniref:DUF6230 family protein n=1 Tax=Haloechinothrix salitolerans TaxID=926830 RepID=A0ABW2C0W3_9PSEU